MSHDIFRELCLIYQAGCMIWSAVYPYLVVFLMIGVCITIIDAAERNWINRGEV
jgi:hypothetical protein